MYHEFMSIQRLVLPLLIVFAVLFVASLGSPDNHCSPKSRCVSKKIISPDGKVFYGCGGSCGAGLVCAVIAGGGDTEATCSCVNQSLPGKQ